MKINIRQFENEAEKLKLLKAMLIRDNPTRDASDIMRECLNLATLLTLPEVQNIYNRFYKNEVEICLKSATSVESEVEMVCC